MADHPTNRERERLIADGVDRALEADEAAELSALADLLADPSTWAEPSAELEDRIVRAVAAADAAAAPPVAGREAGARRTIASRRRRTASLALGAAAAILIVIAGATMFRRGPDPDFTAQLSGTELALGASASGDVTRRDSGFRITLEASGLPHLGDGEYYQAWLKNAAGTLVPIGTFSSSDDEVTLWSGVSPVDYPTMTVTIEAADNQQGSSGRRVLEGPVRAD